MTKQFAPVLFALPLFVFAQTSLPGDVAPTSSNTCVQLAFNMAYRSSDARTNGEVSDLQDFLQSRGYLNSEPTGYFGQLTLAAVKRFQSDNNLLSSGYVGPVTRAKIKALTCGTPTTQSAQQSTTPTTTGASTGVNIPAGNSLSNTVLNTIVSTVQRNAESNQHNTTNGSSTWNQLPNSAGSSTVSSGLWAQNHVCPGYRRTIYLKFTPPYWGSPYLHTSPQNPRGNELPGNNESFQMNDIIVIELQAPEVASQYTGTGWDGNVGSASVAEWLGPPAYRVMSVTSNPCQFNGGNGSMVYDELQGNAVSSLLRFGNSAIAPPQGTSGTSIPQGSTFYLNIKNTGACDNGCDIIWLYRPPHSQLQNTSTAEYNALHPVTSVYISPNWSSQGGSLAPQPSGQTNNTTTATTPQQPTIACPTYDLPSGGNVVPSVSSPVLLTPMPNNSNWKCLLSSSPRDIRTPAQPGESLAAFADRVGVPSGYLGGMLSSAGTLYGSYADAIAEYLNSINGPGTSWMSPNQQWFGH